MARTNVLSRPLPDASLPRNAFDRSFTSKFNMSGGMLLPTFCQFVLGKSNSRINLKNFCRLADVQTAAFTPLQLHTDFFFVPLRQLISTWGAFKTRTNDLHSSKFNVPNQRLPYFTSVQMLDDTFKSGNDELGYSFKDGAGRLLDMLDYGYDVRFFNNATVSSEVVQFSALRACAYQKVFYDHYRNTSYQPNDVYAYNLDQFISEDGSVSQIDNASLKKMFTLRYVNYRKDFFSNMYPSLVYVDAGNLHDSSIPSSIVDVFPEAPYVTSGGSVRPAKAVGPISGSYALGNTTLNQIRASFALDKLLRASAYAPQHVADQYAARYGFRPMAESMSESKRLGSFANDIIVGEVTSTADTQSGSSGARVGTIGGKGVGSSDYQRPINFTAPEDGIIIGMSYLLQRVAYDSLGVDSFNMKLTPEDYFQPEFMNMGLQPIIGRQLFANWVNNTGTTWNNKVLGYTPRYQEYKLGIDRNHGLFKSGLLLSPFTTHTRDYVSEQIISGDPQITARFFKADPADLDSIFVEEYDGSPQSDQLFGIFSFAFACTQNMSVHGQPKL